MWRRVQTVLPWWTWGCLTDDPTVDDINPALPIIRNVPEFP